MLRLLFKSKEQREKEEKQAYQKLRINLHNSDNKGMFKLISKNKKLIKQNPNTIFRELANKGAIAQASFIIEEYNIDMSYIALKTCEKIKKISNKTMKEIREFKLEMLKKFLLHQSPYVYHNAEVEIYYSKDKNFIQKINELILKNIPTDTDKNKNKAFLSYTNTFLSSKLFSDEEKKEFIDHIKAANPTLAEKAIENFASNNKGKDKNLAEKISKLRGQGSNSKKVDKPSEKSATQPNEYKR